MQQVLYLVHDLLSWMRFCGLKQGDVVMASDILWDSCEATMRVENYLLMGSQAGAGKEALSVDRLLQARQDKADKLCQQDCDARWAETLSKANHPAQRSTTIPVLSHSSHVSINNRRQSIYPLDRRQCPLPKI
jgi:hypothetical protein